jgi:uncharacterized Zn finger protein
MVMSSGSEKEFQLAALLNRQTLRRLAGSGAFSRGEAYFTGGRVRSLAQHRGAVVGKVQGSAGYAVKLWAEGKELGYSCNCPRGDDGEFCKHCVAVGLAAMAGKTKPSAPRQPKPKITLDDVREYLSGENKSVLVGLLMERTVWDDALREQLFLKAAKKRRKGGVDVDAIKEALDRAIDPGDYLSWREIGDYSNRVEEAVKTIEEVLEEGNAVEAIELAEHALESTEEAMGSVDDSDGHMGRILARLQELHLRACRKARPDPVALARRLFEREIGTGYDVFHGAVATYSDVLGKKGVAEYRKLAEERWRKVKVLGPGQDDPEKYGSRFRISAIMMLLAQLDGDLDAQVEVLKRDLSHPYSFLKIAEMYREAGKADLALEWAEKGLQAFPARTDSRLREFVADEYHRRKRHDDAMTLAWAEFSQRPDLEQYKNLKRHADRAKAWATWREKALAAIRQDVAKRKREAGKSPWGYRADHSTLVEIFLWEGALETAWKEAQAGGCNGGLWMLLAEKREKEHPEDALPIYQREIESTLSHANNDAYAQAVKLLKKVGQVMTRMGEGRKFSTYLESVRATHARKRNFMRLLSRANWTQAAT